MTNQATDASLADSRWNWLYRMGGAAALFGVVMIPVQLVVFITWPPPDTALGWFTLFQSSKLGGLLAFEFLFVVNAVFGTATTLALYAALRRFNESWMAIALAVGLLEAVALIVARPALEMLFLSERYASTPMEAQRAMLLAAGEALWATFHGTAFHVGYNLFSIYFLIVPLVMLKSNIFGRTTAYIGIVASLLNWGLYVSEIGIVLSMLSVFPLAIWNVLIARRLFQLARGTPSPMQAGATGTLEPLALK